MRHWYYFFILMAVVGCLVLVDLRYRLAIFYDARRTLKTLAAGLLFFSGWDILGIRQGIFRIGMSPYLSGLRLGWQFPIEEIIFLLILSYSALLLYRGGELVWPRT